LLRASGSIYKFLSILSGSNPDGINFVREKK